MKKLSYHHLLANKEGGTEGISRDLSSLEHIRELVQEDVDYRATLGKIGQEVIGLRDKNLLKIGHHIHAGLGKGGLGRKKWGGSLCGENRGKGGSLANSQPPTKKLTIFESTY